MDDMDERSLRQFYENGGFERGSNTTGVDKLILVTGFTAFVGVVYGVAYGMVSLFPNFRFRF